MKLDEELEHPNIREVLKRLKYIQSRMRYNPTEEAQKIIDKDQKEITLHFIISKTIH